MVLQQDGFCKTCGEEYADVYWKWCKICEIDYLKGNFTNLTSENEKIDNFIQEMQLKINEYNDIVFEWIPYNQFSDIKEIGRGGFATVYSAIWKDGPLQYDFDFQGDPCAWEADYIYKSETNKKVALKCLH